MKIKTINRAYVADEASASNVTSAATPFTGSTDTSVIEFLAASTPVGTITETTTAAGGTQVSLDSAGIYHATFALSYGGAVAVSIGISYGATTAPLIADPVLGTDGCIAAVGPTLAVAATVYPLFCSAFITVTDAQIAAGTNILRFLATNAAGAAPVGVVEAGVQYRVQKTANLSI